MRREAQHHGGPDQGAGQSPLEYLRVVDRKRSYKALYIAMILRCHLHGVHADALRTSDIGFRVIQENTVLGLSAEFLGYSAIDRGVGFVQTEFEGKEVMRADVKETRYATSNGRDLMRANVAQHGHGVPSFVQV